MKFNTKKLTAVLLVMVMVLSLSVSVFAGKDPGAIAPPPNDGDPIFIEDPIDPIDPIDPNWPPIILYGKDPGA